MFSTNGEKYKDETDIFLLTDRLEHDAGLLIELVAVLCIQLLYFLIIAFNRSFNNELYASRRYILNNKTQFFIIL